MADLTSDAYIKTRGNLVTQRFLIDTSSAWTFYKGQAVLIDQSVDAENVVPYVDAVVVDPADVVVGIAQEGKTVVAAAAETTEISVYIAPSVIGFQSAVFTNADIGKLVYMSDSGVLSETAADNPLIGKLTSVEDGFAFVLLSTPVIPTGA